MRETLATSFPLSKAVAASPFHHRDWLTPLVCLFVYLFIYLIVFSVFHLKTVPLSFATRRCRISTSTRCSCSHNCGCIPPWRLPRGGNPPPSPCLLPGSLTSSRQLHHSSLAGRSSRDVMAGRPIPVALWDAVRLATVCRRTRTSRQSLSRLLHSLQAAEELREVRCWHGG